MLYLLETCKIPLPFQNSLIRNFHIGIIKNHKNHCDKMHRLVWWFVQCISGHYVHIRGHVSSLFIIVPYFINIVSFSSPRSNLISGFVNFNITFFFLVSHFIYLFIVEIHFHDIVMLSFIVFKKIMVWIPWTEASRSGVLEIINFVFCWWFYQEKETMIAKSQKCIKTQE